VQSALAEVVEDLEKEFQTGAVSPCSAGIPCRSRSVTRTTRTARWGSSSCGWHADSPRQALAIFSDAPTCTVGDYENRTETGIGKGPGKLSHAGDRDLVCTGVS